MTATSSTDPFPPHAAAYELEASLRIAVTGNLAEVEPVWKELEGRAVLSPYQRFDWIEAYFECGFDSGAETAFVTLYDENTAIALLPLTITRKGMVRVGQMAGTGISNMDCLIFDPAYRHKLTPSALRAMFAALGAAGFRVDLVRFHCIFPDWQGVSNPLLQFPHTISPNRLYFIELEPFDPAGNYALPMRRRKNIRYSQRKLEAEYGPLRLVRAGTDREVEEFEALFFEQRARRFEEMGVENIFARPEFRRFFTTLAERGKEQAAPAMAIHVLYAGSTALATSMGTYSGRHCSHYMNSTTAGGPAKYSIIGVLLTMLIDELRRDGITSFDIGLGDFAYKAEWTNPCTVYDCLVPVTFTGRATAPAFALVRWLKRIIKQTPALWRFARRVLALKARLGKS